VLADFPVVLCHSHLLLIVLRIVIMKFSSLAAIAAPALFWDALTSASPLKVDVFEVSVLGGMTFKINQTPNKAYTGRRKGPLAVAKALSKYGVAYPDELVTVLQELAKELKASNSTGNSSKAPQGK
jgi:hypothetical protein